MNLVWFISYFDFRQQMFSVNSSLLKMTLLKLTGQQGLPVFQFCFQSSHRQHINNTLKTEHGLTCLQSSACFLSLNIGRALSASNLGRGQGRICSGFSVKKKNVQNNSNYMSSRLYNNIGNILDWNITIRIFSLIRTYHSKNILYILSCFNVEQSTGHLH